MIQANRLRPGMVLIHGGAGDRKPNARQRRCLTEALAAGFQILQSHMSALEAVEAMIRLLEGSGLFNAGCGSRLQLDGIRRMDAAIMEGRHLQAGAVAGLEKIRHPISAARLVMERTKHVLLVGRHATGLARRFKLELDVSAGSSARPTSKSDTRKNKKNTLSVYENLAQYDTVGAVALDREGTIAAGASTGGISQMLPGRVGDTPLIGCGVYADNAGGGVSMTGIGETIIRLALAKQIAMDLKQGANPPLATRRALRELVQRIQGAAGALVLAADGRYAIGHTTRWMGAGYWRGRGKPVVADRFG
ncbi:MAG: isoaspartyl peptidase/L-asparaginase family protein [Nitrospirae bacterium]|nr:isoaspartyl peptidase/L-asparaginase family protein [Nitrospirota bacterium]